MKILKNSSTNHEMTENQIQNYQDKHNITTVQHGNIFSSALLRTDGLSCASRLSQFLTKERKKILLHNYMNAL